MKILNLDSLNPPQPAPIPPSLQAGYIPYAPGRNGTPPSREDSPAYLQPRMAIGMEGSYEDLPSGNRSPAMSTSSHFTSISQRGVNPNWKPSPGEAGGPRRGPPLDRAGQQQLLTNNPDFELPNAGGIMGPRAQRGRGGRYGGM